MATHSSILAWEIPQTDSGLGFPGLQFMELLFRHDLATKQQTTKTTIIYTWVLECVYLPKLVET